MSKRLNGNVFAYQLKSARMANGFSREEIACKSGVSINNIIKFEIGSKMPSAKEAIALASSLGVPIEMLMGEPISRSDGVFFDAKSSVQVLTNHENTKKGDCFANESSC